MAGRGGRAGARRGARARGGAGAAWPGWGSRGRQREALGALLREVEGARGGRCSAEKAAAVGAAAEALEAAAAAPGGGTILSGRLEGRWDLIYTTENDVHLFQSLGAGEIFQEIDLEGMRLSNNILFPAGCSLRAEAPVRVRSADSIEYYFDKIILRVFGLPIPWRLSKGPGGWSRTVFVEDERVVRNSRGDLLVLRRRATAAGEPPGE